MSGFKLSNLNSKRAAQIRRGVVSGKILLGTVQHPKAGIAHSVLPVWLAKKLRTYVDYADSYLEKEALMRTVAGGIRRTFTEDQISIFCKVYSGTDYM